MSGKNNIAPINEHIKARTMTVIDDEGVNLGEMSRDEALELSSSKDLDLVLISNKNGICITKILNYGKFKYEQKIKIKTNKAKQTIVKNKEIKVKPLIGDHDLHVRAKNAIKWLNDGNRVSFIIVARGRISTKVDLIDVVYQKFIDLLDGNGKVVIEKKKVNNYRYESLIVPAQSKK